MPSLSIFSIYTSSRERESLRTRDKSTHTRILHVFILKIDCIGLKGFLSGESKDFPGNYGLHDQTMALHWVSKNIHWFGGDPTKVTIEGHSAGGTDVGQHVLSPLSKGIVITDDLKTNR